MVDAWLLGALLFSRHIDTSDDDVAVEGRPLRSVESAPQNSVGMLCSPRATILSKDSGGVEENDINRPCNALSFDLVLAVVRFEIPLASILVRGIQTVEG